MKRKDDENFEEYKVRKMGANNIVESYLKGTVIWHSSTNGSYSYGKNGSIGTNSYKKANKIKKDYKCGGIGANPPSGKKLNNLIKNRLKVEEIKMKRLNKNRINIVGVK